MSYYEVCKENIILADCEVEELNEFVKGLRTILDENFIIKSNIPCVRRSILGKLRRYIAYMIFPVFHVFNHKKYKYVIGWQQFYTLFYTFYCRLFHVKKDNIIIVLNFTYIEKKGVLGKIYKAFMNYCIKSNYIDYIHVPSNNYAKNCTKIFDISEKKFIVSPFGLPDTYTQWKDSTVEYKDYSFSIGRSNRDFEFLVNVWKKMPKDEILIIASDVYKPIESLPENIIHRTNISGDAQFAYIANCKSMIISIDDGKICSGDTVLLKAMSYEKPVIVTMPSTLGEMYIDNNINGILVEKKADIFSTKIKDLYKDKNKMKTMGKNARKKFLLQFSREKMAINIIMAICAKNDI